MSARPDGSDGSATPEITDPRLQGVLAAIARGVLGDQATPEVPGRLLELIRSLPSEADRKQLLQALRMLWSPAGALLVTGRPRAIQNLSPEGVGDLLARLRTSRLGLRRKLANALIPATLAALYTYPGPAWARIGYPGPLGPAPEGPKRLSPLPIEGNERLTCDVVVVGSGAGGGCAAGILAGAGLDVVILEKGGYRDGPDFTHVEAEANRDLYLYGLTIATNDVGVRILAGRTLGGGTVVNYTTSFPTPRFVLEEWAAQSGIDAFVSGEFEESLDRASSRLGVNTEHGALSARDAIMERGLKAMGWQVDAMPRNVRGCTQDAACGYCGFGCRIGAKQSSLRTYLEDAAAHGARIVVDADVRKVSITDGRATGVEARVGRHQLAVDAKAVVVAGGSIESPALLLRSGLGGEVGKHLHLHPGIAAWGVFDDEVRMWEGTLQSRYSTEFREWDGGYGPIFETVPVHPGTGAAAIPWVSAADHARRMAGYRNTTLCAVLARDRTDGRVTIGRDGNPRVEYRLTPSDEALVARGVENAGRLLEAAGAREVFSPHAEPISYRPGSGGAHEEWAAATRRAGYRRGVTFFSFHQMGSCRMGTDPTRSVVGPENETYEVKGLYVMDASAFPTASGVNPMLTIYGIADRAARKLAARL